MSVRFNGVSSTGPLDLTSQTSDSTKALIHMWINPNGVDATLRYLWANDVVYAYVRINATTNKLACLIKSSANVTLAYVLQTGSLTPVTGWIAVDIVADSVANYTKLYIDGVLESSAVCAAGNFDWTRANNFFGARTGSTEGYIGDLHQFAIWTSFTADYVSATGELTAKYFAEMYDMDSAGALYPKETIITAVTGGQPLVLFENSYSTFTVNNGTATDATAVTGTLLPASSEPPYGTWTFTP